MIHYFILFENSQFSNRELLNIILKMENVLILIKFKVVDDDIKSFNNIIIFKIEPINKSI